MEVERDDAPVLLHAYPALHEDGVAPAVAVEDLLSRQADLDGASRFPRQRGDHDLVAERIGLAAETAAVRGGDHADVRRRHLQYLGQRAVHVMRRLRARPERELAVGGPLRERGVLLHGEVRVPLVEEHVLADEVGGGHGVIHVAELEGDLLVDVPRVGVVVELRRRRGDAVLDGVDVRERLVLHLDQVARLGG